MTKFRMIKRKPTMLVPNKSDIDLEWTNRNKINQNEPVSTCTFVKKIFSRIKEIR